MQITKKPARLQVRKEGPGVKSRICGLVRGLVRVRCELDLTKHLSRPSFKMRCCGPRLGSVGKEGEGERRGGRTNLLVLVYGQQCKS